MVTQGDLFDQPTGREAARLAIQQAADNADPDWMADAHTALRWCATHYYEFSANDVWNRMQAASSTTHEPRAMGAVMREAAKANVIAKTDRAVPSQIPRQHHRPVAVWRSLIFRP